ncbi:uncharacterized protein LOC119579033 [Penaeus monodon]|uniref:uncharacterized protein LOC119579033 n=1 Tax=Penaeus monodon TaxID=6687 RepID=UPI0018A7528F|nr:uncharacterized protein LOC119579033 [Penaeus monodon]
MEFFESELLPSISLRPSVWRRKPMHSDMYIDFSYHPLHVKRGVATSLFLRTLSICDPQYLDGEIDFLRRHFSKLGYPRHVLDVALSTSGAFYHDSSPKETPHLLVLSLPYTEEIYSPSPSPPLSTARCPHPQTGRIFLNQASSCFSPADSLLASHILYLLPYACHPSHRPPDSST